MFGTFDTHLQVKLAGAFSRSAAQHRHNIAAFWEPDGNRRLPSCPCSVAKTPFLCPHLRLGRCQSKLVGWG